MFVCDCIAGVKKHSVVQSAATNILEVTMADQASSGVLLLLPHMWLLLRLGLKILHGLMVK